MHRGARLAGELLYVEIRALEPSRPPSGATCHRGARLIAAYGRPKSRPIRKEEDMAIVVIDMGIEAKPTVFEIYNIIEGQ